MRGEERRREMGIKLKGLVAIVVVSLFLTPFCVGVGGKDLEKSKFVEVKGSPSVQCEEIAGKIKAGSEVSVTVVLTNFSQEIEESTLVFYSDLEDAGGHVGDGSRVIKDRGSFTVRHREFKDKDKELRIVWSGKAPELKTQQNTTLLSITQEITGEYLVVSVRREVSSEEIEEALNALSEARAEIENANSAISNATKHGVEVSEAETNLENANFHFRDANNSYWQGRAGESVTAAREAAHFARLAKERAESGSASVKCRNYGVLVGVVVLAVAVLVFLIIKRGRKRGIY